MKTIALSQRLLDTEAYPETREALDVRWGALFEAAGLIPAPLCSRFDNTNALFDGLGVEGLVLSGGNDLATVSEDPLNRERDAFETRLLDTALARELPVLGICRGAQFIAAHFGGSLIPVEEHVATRHTIRVKDDARYAALLDGIDEVNSYHSWSPGVLPEGLNLLAGATDDGAVEALEHASLPILAILWHPEREDPFRAPEIELLRRFFA